MIRLRLRYHLISAFFSALILTTFNLNAQDDFDIGTDLSLEDLVFVKVSVASKTAEKISDAPGVVSVITQDQLKRFGGTTLGDVLKRVPSLLGTTVYMTDRSVIAARGDQVMPSSSHILFLINGRPVREILEGGIKSEMYETFPIDVIERIEVIRGPGSVLYGSQAFSGVINIVTKSANINTFSVSGALGTGLRNNVTTHANYKFGDFGIVLAGRYADKGGWKTTWQTEGIPDSLHNFNSLHSIDVEIPDYSPGLFGEITYKGFRAMCSFNQWNYQYFVPDYQPYANMVYNEDATGRIIWTKFFGDIGYEHTFNDAYSSSINATYTRSLVEPQKFPYTSRDGFEIVVEQTNFFTPIENFKITLGEVWGFMTGEEGDWKTDVMANKGNKQNTFSSYLQLDYKWDWVKAIGGIQMNKVEGFDIDFNPRGGLIFYPFENVNIKALYSTAFRAPSLDELFLDHPTMRGQMVDRNENDIIRQKKLKPEKNNTFDFGLNYQDSTVQFGINAFHSDLKNLIIQDRDKAHYDIPTWDNIGEVTIFGLECEGKAYLTREFLFEGSFLYQESKDKNTNEEHVTPLPTFSVKGGVSYMGHGLTISAFNTFSQALDERYAAKLNKTNDYINMVDVYCSYNFNELINSSFLNDLSLVLSINNLLDEEVWLPAWGLNLGSTIPYNKGRVIYGGFKFSF